ncbi:helix-turn-helix transcriptional regulator [Paenibacillus sp. EZ-K15]|uniref:helix-turn-helix domain-containing protein n=1 Tax=Paenibacillus sp. EZ-K15 TaxID=2044275 RepID=UPI000BF35722|nr:helix-turn-helix transcriptional regulator [Paenibacillus sp. EZ-K15]
MLLKMIGERIKQLRKKQGMTQEELAEKAGINASYIGTVERGERNISIETLEKIIEGLGVSSAAMFQFHETESLDTASEKAEILESISSLLYSRTLAESKLLFRVLKDIVDTMDHREN